MKHPTFTHDTMVLEPRALRYNPHDDLIFPSVIDTAGRIAGALGRFYMYCAPHDAPGGICLAYADELVGPWREYRHNPIITRDWSPHYRVGHVSSPHAL